MTWQIFDYILLACGGIVLTESTMIITVNTKRGYWNPTTICHVLSTVLYLIYVSTVLYSSVERNKSNQECDMLWKICSTLYMSVTMSVYSFYYVKSRVVNSVLWRGKTWSGRFVLIMIVMMGISGLCFFWSPIKDIQYNGILVNGECRLVKRLWILIFWVSGDSVISVLLLALFIKPLKNLKAQFATTIEVEKLRSMEQVTKKNRNLLLFTVTVTIALYTTIAVAGNLTMRTVIHLGAVDRLVTLQCITMTFSYGKRDFICFIPFLKRRTPETVEQEEKSSSDEIQPRNSLSTSIFIMYSYSTEEKSLN